MANPECGGNPCSIPLCGLLTEKSGAVGGGGDSFGLLHTVSHPQSHASREFTAFLLTPDCEDQETSRHLVIVCLSLCHTN